MMTPHELNAESLRQLIRDRLGHAQVAPRHRIIAGDHALDPVFDRALDQAPRPVRELRILRDAAVLVPIIAREDGLTVLFTRRAEDMPHHPGQVAFPGGRVDAGDADANAAALRETHEETGIAPHFVTVEGQLDRYETGTGFVIVPVVGIVRPGFSLNVNPTEVAAVFEVPFGFLMDPANHQRHSGEWKGVRREYFAMPYDGHYIWGATAGMIVNLHRRLFT